MLRSFFLGVIVIGIESQSRASQLIHDITGGRFQDHILKEVIGKSTVLAQKQSKFVQLGLIGELTCQQKINDLLIAEAILGNSPADKVTDIIASENKFTLARLFFALIHNIAVNVAYICNACHNACSVGVTQTSFYVILIKIFGIYNIILTESGIKCVHIDLAHN